MVKYNSHALNDTFAALSDATRRALVAQLAAAGEQSISALARPFPLSLPAIMKHLKVLCDAGLVVREKRGRTVHCRLNAEPLGDAGEWLAYYEKFWAPRLDQLGQYLEKP
jgi:DNA-binding transcriptional ArsR family regulator